ncbi:MAG: DNA-formamidopyrimidine glycosylase [Streptococcaceae bacterium]|jgi:formamidopyrimidine-DNA glycosylase|nr:DNA-formamidopyrimidine glycosylase [Streptococcaceae bacterium]
MPELPEVEVVRRGLEQYVLGKTIKAVDVLFAGIVDKLEVSQFLKKLQGERIEYVLRRGKFLIFKLSNYDLISHLRMEGKYEFHKQKEQTINKHVHVIFTFTDETQLWYKDTRKFGRMTLVEKDQALNYKGLQKLGPEPTDADFSFSVFWEQLAGQKKPIKPLLLEQKLVAGLGNIYVDEVLWKVQIHPKQPGNTLLFKEALALHHAIIEILVQAIKKGGTTIRSYKNAWGEAGRFQSELNVYGQAGKSCVCCQKKIKKMQIAKRGTHYCPNCQKIYSRLGRGKK